MAGLECIFMPFGTVLGVFTIIVLMRDTVKELFGRAVALLPASSIDGSIQPAIAPDELGKGAPDARGPAPVTICRPLGGLQEGAVMSILNRLLRQCKRPNGSFGRVLARGMNSSHSPLTTWAIRHIEVTAMRSPSNRVRRRQDRRPPGKNGSGRMGRGPRLLGGSVVVSRRKNAKHIHNGSVEICHASVSSIPFEDNTFDLVTAVETFYFWPALDTDLLEVKRVIRPGGELFIACTMYKGGRYERAIGSSSTRSTCTTWG